MPKIVYFLAKTYWFVLRPRTFGVKCLIMCGDELLLIRNIYGKNWWNLVGGGIEKGETPEEAIVREVREETGIELQVPTYVGSFYTDYQYKQDTVFCFVATVYDKKITIDHREILEAGWYDTTHLPDDLSSAVTKALHLHEHYTRHD